MEKVINWLSGAASAVGGWAARTGKAFWDNRQTWFSRFFLALGPFVSYVYVEILNGNKPFHSIEFWRVCWNFIWYIVLYALFWLVTGRRRRTGAIVTSIVTYLFGVTNYYVLRFRGTMFFPIDILSWQTAANVSAGYDYTPDKVFWKAFVIFAAYLLIWIFLLRSRKKAKRAGWILSTSIGVVLAVFLYVFFGTSFCPDNNMYAEQWVTQRNGFVFNFMLSLRYSFVEKPDGYSEQAVTKLENDFKASETTQTTTSASATKPVNIIIIMNESYADLSIFDGFTVDNDPLPFYHSLKENTIKGFTVSPVFGGGTANVEYEMLTGNPSTFLPDGTVAYQLYVTSETASLARLAKTQGYTSYAFHPYLASGWNRVQAYGYLGFDNQFFAPDVQNPELVRCYISDKSDFEKIEQTTEQDTGSVFFFNVTMQNHSGYALGWNNLPHDIHLTGKLAGTDEAAEQYLCLIHQTDEALQQLIEYYEKSDEPTIIAMFGDHQPPLTATFYDAIMGKPAAERTNEENLKKYYTPFLIWANYDIPEQDNVVLGANYFGNLVAKTAGLPQTDYMKFLDSAEAVVPVLHDIGYVTADGKFYNKFSQLGVTAQKAVSDYKILAYHNLFESQPHESFFELK
jgi:phosphoglycerol transferase MdoB-like AlkP superfamily enzyme